jgi:cellulose synthase (UDP-forming)
LTNGKEFSRELVRGSADGPASQPMYNNAIVTPHCIIVTYMLLCITMNTHTRHSRAVLRLLLIVGIALTILFGQWWFRPEHISSNFHGAYHIFDYALFAVLSYIIWHQISMEVLTWSIVRKMHKSRHPRPAKNLKVAFITTYVPGAETPELLHNILPALAGADYPHDTWLLDEGADKGAKALCEQYGVHYFTRSGLKHYNTAEGKFAAKTKGGNHNAWYDHIGKTYDFVAQIDTDFIPQKNFLTHTLGYFRDPTVAFVGTPQVYGNLDSWIAKGAAQQQYSFYGPILRGLFGHQMPMMLGANHVVRVSALRHIGFYAGHLTEDLLTGMRLHSKRYRSVYVPKQLAVGEGPTTWSAYFNQQTRWAHGCIDILFHDSFKLFRTMELKKSLHYYFMQQHYFTGLASILGVLLLTIYFLLGVTPSSIMLLPLLSLYLPLLLWQYLIHLRLQDYYINPETEKGFQKHGMMIGIAAWPIYFLAFVGVICNKRLSFKVTPKGESSVMSTDLKLFLPHIVIGSVTAIDLLSIPFTHHDGAVMIFWATLTTVSMYGIAFHEQFIAAYKFFQKVLQTEIRSILSAISSTA